MDYNFVKVTSLEQLDELLEQDYHDYVIAGNGMRSSKFIDLNEDGTYYVLHLVDDTEEEMSPEEMMDSNIGIAVRNGNFYCDIE